MELMSETCYQSSLAVVARWSVKQGKVAVLVHRWVCLHKPENHSKAGYLYQVLFIVWRLSLSCMQARNSYSNPPKLNTQ